MSNNSKTKLGLWQSTFFSIAGLVLIVLLAYLVEKIVNPDYNRVLLTFISVIIAIIPPLLWLSVFYRQDRLNPEPKSFVFKTLLLGALVQKAVYSPLISLLYPNGASGSSPFVMSSLLVITVIAFLQEGVKLLAVRYSIYPSKEFDEKIDGIIYGSAMGLGFATMTSIDNIISTGGAMLTNVTSLVVIETFAHASITGLSCYILGVSKQKKLSLIRLPAALVLAAALNTVTNILLDSVTRRGFKVSYIVGLIPAALVAILVFTVLVIISSRNEKEGSEIKLEALDVKKSHLAILPVWVLLVVVVIIGVIVGNPNAAVATSKIENGIELKYPANWIKFTGEDNLFKAADMIKGGGQDFVSVKKLSLDSLVSVGSGSEEEMLQNAAASWSIKAGMNYRFYQAEQGYFLNSKGKETYVINYIYIDNKQSTLSDTSKPAIGYGRDILSISGNDLYIVTLSSSYDKYILNNGSINGIDYAFSAN